jgi:peptidoglycan/LPS O-acetylase OafA/YrhL
MSGLHARNTAIDAGRGVAILAVMAFHYLVRWAPPFSDADLYGFDAAYSPVFEIGRYGVHVFFVISGLVITMTVLRSRDAMDFAVRRFARIYPAFLVSALLTFALMRLAGPPEFQIGGIDLLANVPVVADDLGRKFVDGAYWSLSVEVKFYLFVAISFAAFGPRLWVALIALGFAGTALDAYAPRLGALLVAQYMPFFLFGMAGWYLLLERSKWPGCCTGAAGLILYLLHCDAMGPVAGLWWPAHVFVLGTAGLMMVLLAAHVSAGLGWLAWIGRISYSLYLVHQRIGVTLIGRMKDAHVPDAVAIAAAFAMSIALAALMFYGIELPAQRALLNGWEMVRSLRRQKPVPAEIP